MKSALKGRRFQDIEDIQENVTKELSSKNFSNSGSIVDQSAQLFKGTASKMSPLTTL
jgi:hypothetical protein